MANLRPRSRNWTFCIGLFLVAGWLNHPAVAQLPAPDPFLTFELPVSWQDRFWDAPGVAELLDLKPQDLASRIPAQAGFRHVRCPVCDVETGADSLTWSPSTPDVVTCCSCEGAFPNDQFPAKVNDIVPADTIEVEPGVVHTYPYHTIEPLRQLFPDERIYLHAKRDYECRQFLAKLALYAAIKHRDSPAGNADSRLARAGAVLLLRFAQVYPNYATHFDQPGQPKFLQRARPEPPFRRGYGTGKWDWLGCLDVPMNLAIAYAILRDHPALIEAGQALNEADPRRTIEEDLFRASSEFVREQSEEYSENSLYAYRGLLAVGRLLNDVELMHEGVERLEAFARRGFHFDGLWRQGDTLPHRRVVSQIDGWIDRLLAGYSDPPASVAAVGRRFESISGATVVPQVALARDAESVPIQVETSGEVVLASWPMTPKRPAMRRPVLLGGAGIARLALGEGANALDLELRGLGDFDAPRSNRLALRVAVGGESLLGDLDDQPARTDGFDRASASHNTALIDGLNQRETLDLARIPAPGADIRYYAAAPDFQVAVLEDRFAYPKSATRYRRFVVASSGSRTRYAVDLFDLEGGAQHDVLFHGAVSAASRWQLSIPTVPGPETLLPPAITFVPTAPVVGGRWFIQAYGAFEQLKQGLLDGPAQATLLGAEHGVRLHLMGDHPATVYLGQEPSASLPNRGQSNELGRAVLIMRRQTRDPKVPLATRSVTVIEPTSASIEPLTQVGRVASPPDTILILTRSTEGEEYLALNLTPGTAKSIRLADGRDLHTDGLAVRVRGKEIVLAGGTFAELGAARVAHPRFSGTIVQSFRGSNETSHGAFQTSEPIEASEDLAGCTLLVRHGDGTSRAWTIARVERDGAGHSRIFVREEPGFQVHPDNGNAYYYQFPRTQYPGPHRFVVARLARS